METTGVKEKKKVYRRLVRSGYGKKWLLAGTRQHRNGSNMNMTLDPRNCPATNHSAVQLTDHRRQIIVHRRPTTDHGGIRFFPNLTPVRNMTGRVGDDGVREPLEWLETQPMGPATGRYRVNGRYGACSTAYVHYVRRARKDVLVTTSRGAMGKGRLLETPPDASSGGI